MLKQDTRLPHSDVTNHRIVAFRGEPYPESAFPRATAQLPDLIHLDAVPGSEHDPLSPLTLLHAYQKILMKEPNPAYEQRMFALLGQLAETDSNNPVVLSALARKEWKKGTPEGKARAIDDLQRAMKLGSATPEDNLLLAEILRQSGRAPESVDLLRQAIAQDPYVIAYYRWLATWCLKYEWFQDGAEIIKKGLQLFPEDQFLRRLQAATENSIPRLRDVK